MLKNFPEKERYNNYLVLLEGEYDQKLKNFIHIENVLGWTEIIIFIFFVRFATLE